MRLSRTATAVAQAVPWLLHSTYLSPLHTGTRCDRALVTKQQGERVEVIETLNVWCERGTPRDDIIVVLRVTTQQDARFTCTWQEGEYGT